MSLPGFAAAEHSGVRLNPLLGAEATSGTRNACIATMQIAPAVSEMKAKTKLLDLRKVARRILKRKGVTASIAVWETETGFPQFMHFAERTGPRKNFLDCVIAFSLQCGHSSIVIPFYVGSVRLTSKLSGAALAASGGARSAERT